MTGFEKVKQDIEGSMRDLGNGDFGEGYCRGYVNSAYRFGIIEEEDLWALKKMILLRYQKEEV